MATVSGTTSASFRAAARRIATAARAIRRPLREALYGIGEEIKTDVQSSAPGRGVPVDKGALRASGRVDYLAGSGKPRVAITFGGASAPYALIQHEVLRYRHTVGEPRYLVRGLERWKPEGSSAMAGLAANAAAAFRS